MSKFLDYDGLLYFWSKIKAKFVAKESGKGLSTNDYTTTEKNKLANIAAGAEVNQNAFSNVKVGSTTIAADGKTDTLTVVAGDYVTIIADATNDKITIDAKQQQIDDEFDEHSANPVQNVTILNALNRIDKGEKIFYGACSTAAATTAKAVTVNSPSGTGFNAFSLTAGATVCVIFSETNTGAVGSVTLNVNSTGAKAIKYMNNGTLGNLLSAGQLAKDVPVLFIYNGSYWVATGINYNTTYNAATQSANGLMASGDKKKLDGIATGAEVNQNAYSNIKVGSTTVAADAKTDTIELVAGSNVTITPDATNDKITIAATNTTYSTMSANEANTGTATTSRVITAKVLADYVNGKVSTAIAGVTQFSYEFVNSFADLPATGQKGVIYLVSHAHEGQNDGYDEYIWTVETSGQATTAAYEKLGHNDIDLSGYWKKADLVAITNSEIDTIVAS